VAVEKPSAEYLKFSDKWQRCRDVDCGQDAMHAAGVRYVPMLKEQYQADYAAYVLRGTFFNATARTVSGLVGMLFRQPPKVDVPAGINDYLNDVTMSGKSMDKLAEEMAKEEILIGRSGLLVDYPIVDVATMTQADAEALNLRPTMQLYKAESILDARWGRVKNATVLTMARLKELASVPGNNEFEEKMEDRFRVLDLAEGKYRVRIFKVDSATGQDVLLEEFTPLMNGEPMDYIPFDVEPDIEEPPLLDLVNTNVSHYRTTVDYEHGCHWTGLSQPWVAGWTPDNPGDKLYFGGGNVWSFRDPGSVPGILSLDHDFVALAANLTRKEQQMAVLGARMLEAQKKAVETAETTSIHRKGEESLLSATALEISTRIERALGWFADWAGASGKVTYQINRDFYPRGMTAPEILARVQSWQQGAPGFSDQSLLEQLQRGDVVSADLTLEEEQARIATQAPRLQGQPVGPDGKPITPAPLNAPTKQPA